MAVVAASTARWARAARLRGRVVGGGGGEAVGWVWVWGVWWEKMKGRPTKMSFRRRESLRWAFERKVWVCGEGLRVCGGRDCHQARRDWQMSTMRSK